jgi:hypothetical protein
VVLLLAGMAGPVMADRIDDLLHALTSDPSYKVRVQAALVLGKLADKRAVPALLTALKDENETVRGVAATSLGRIGEAEADAVAALRAAASDPSAFVRAQAQASLTQLEGATAKAGARFYLSVGFASAKVGSPYARVVHDALERELGKLPAVTLSVPGGALSAAAPTGKKLEGFIVDGSIQRLTASPSGQIDCDLKAFVATYPGKAIKMMTSAGASFQGAPSEGESNKRDCLVAAVEAVRDDVGKFLQTQP